MNILCIIPARGGSKSLKNKNILPLLGKPVIAYTIEAALKSKLINKVVVSTDDKKIANVARRYDIQVIMRPKQYATDSAPIQHALRHAVRYLKKTDNYTPEIVVWLQANVPIRKEGKIDKVIMKLMRSGADSAATIYQVNQYPQWMKKINKQGFLKPLFPREKLYRRQDLEPMFLLDGAVIAIREKVLMNEKNGKAIQSFMGKRVAGVLESNEYTLEIDHKDDFGLAEYYLKSYRRKQ